MNNPNLSDNTNRNITQSELEGGVFLFKLKPGTVLQVLTQHSVYLIEVVEGSSGRVMISGHHRYCPNPTQAWIHGSAWGGSILKMNFIGRGMNLEFSTRDHPQEIVTSTIQDVRELNPGGANAI